MNFIKPAFVLFLFFSLTAQGSFAIAHSIEYQSISYQKKEQTKYIQLSFRNNSLKSIPLIIPGVMNPNLSPMSNSGVSLKIGQNVYFKVKRKKYLLLTVDETLENGMVLKINELIRERKKELGYKKVNKRFIESISLSKRGV